MSTLLYGSLLAARCTSPPEQPPTIVTVAADATKAEDSIPRANREADALAIPAEVAVDPHPQIADPTSAAEDQQLDPVTTANETVTMNKVSYWQDALAALVPAEVLAIHGIAVSVAAGIGTALPWWLFVTLVLLTMGLSLGATIRRSPFLVNKPAPYAGAAIAAAAFVLWSMLQPNSAFDSLTLNLSALNRTLIPIVGAVVLALLAGLLAWQQQIKEPSSSGGVTH